MSQTVAEHLALGPLWDATKNPDAASTVSAMSYKAAWWSCPRGHAFQRAPRALLRDPACPQCKVAGSSASLADKRPALAALWHPEKNGDLTPSTVDATSTAPCWWRCPAGHDFQRAPLLMIRDAECPTCALAKTSLVVTHPTIAAEWNTARNGAVTPQSVDADHIMTAWWTCPKGHDYQATVRSRAKGGSRCPTCYAGWSLEHIREFVQALLAHVGAFDPSEKFALAMQAGLLKDKASRPFVKAFTSGKFPVAELEKFLRGEPSLVDGFMARGGGADPHDDGPILQVVEPEPERRRTDVPDDRFALPSAPEPEDAADIDVGAEVDVHGPPDAKGDGELPVVTTREALQALDSALIASADAETVKFLLDSAKAKLWRHAYLNPKEAREHAASFQGDVYSSLVRDRFLAEFDEAEALVMPKGYAFQPVPGGPIVPPNLMQRRVAVCVRQARRFGNWSGMGAGKTLSAILATRVAGASLTVICCPNAVVDNWAREIDNAFSGCEVAKKTWTPEWRDPLASAPRYLVLNYEQFQQPDSEARLVAFLEKNVVDFVVVDEIHYAKQRDEGAAMSKRKRLVQGLVLEAGKKNAELCVLGMSGTPVINVLQEGKSLVELITGHRHDDLETKATVQNCMRLYQRLVTLGTRWRPNYAIQLTVRREEIDCSSDLHEIRLVGQGSTLELEQVLTRLRLPTILANIARGEKVLVYTHLVDGIAKDLLDAIKAAGHSAGLLTGETDDSDLREFLKPNGAVDVLIASSRIGTGVDGLQHVCNKLIINVLPWTNAEYEQLIGRLYRQGSKFAHVDVVIPVTFAMVNGERWSYCESKLNRLEYKKSIADAAVDGVVPEGNLRTPSQAQQDIMRWLARLEEGAVETIARRKIVIPLSGEPTEVKRRVAAYGDFTRINNRWYAASSQKTHARLEANAEEWAHYHTLYREARQSWPVVPFEEEIRWLEQRDPLVIGDFGCGEAIIAERVGAKHDVRSFDHVAVNPSVVACDIAAVPLGDGELDVAIFCLSLMGANFTDYLREAHRCLRLDGRLHIWEPASHFDDIDAFCTGLARLGFEVMDPRQQGAFTRIRAVKATTVTPPNVVLHFRGRSAAVPAE
ncbi:zinc-ribbon domain-containing protein [Sorangium sp. So ce448]|uniref:zinc-ribbon domain-containing protein n=1 Tax=Sorangium sp. So ce448 TaxID=3133314 RepID=UPI003F647DE6